MKGIRMQSVLRTGIFVVAVHVGGVASGVAAAPVFDFGYRIVGDREVRPVQVFDDGLRTFFQFRPGAVIPVITSGPDGVLEVPTVEGPYHVVHGVPRTFGLRAPGRRGRVESTAASTSVPSEEGRPPTAASRATGSYAAPLRGDLLDAVPAGGVADHVVLFGVGRDELSPVAAADLSRRVNLAGPDPSVELIGGDGPLGDRRIRSVVHALVRRGVSPTRITVASTDVRVHRSAAAVTVRWRGVGALPLPAEALAGGVQGRPLPNQFDVLLSDRTMAQTLQRWAARDGYRVEWQSSVHAPVVGEVTVDAATLPDAASRVIAGLRAAGYPLRLEYVGNQVMRITPDAVP